MSCCDKKKSPWRIALWIAVILGILAFVIVADAFG